MTWVRGAIYYSLDGIAWAWGIFYWCWFWNSNHPVSLKLCGTKKLPYCVSPRRHFLASNSFQPNTPTHPSSNLGWKDRETYCERVENSTIDEGHAPGTSVICTLWVCFIEKHLVFNSFFFLKETTSYDIDSFFRCEHKQWIVQKLSKFWIELYNFRINIEFFFCNFLGNHNCFRRTLEQSSL